MTMKLKTKVLTLILSIIILIGLFSLGVFADSSSTPTPSNEASYSARASHTLSLTAIEKQVYDDLFGKIKKVASGEITSTSFTLDIDLSSFSWSKDEIGCTIISGGVITEEVNKAVGDRVFETINLHRIIDYLISDLPFDLFWYDKTIGVYYGLQISGSVKEVFVTGIYTSFTVSVDYRTGGANNYKVDSAKIASARSVLSRAQSIVEKYEGKSDLEKLEGYRDEICNLVSYNNSVAGGGYFYGNPWQIIYVFDGNSSTNVVCEGYAKAFKYLCDISDFDKEIHCYLAEGRLSDDNVEGQGHMWNVLSIDGVNYMVDVTNYDIYPYFRSDLFLGGAKGSANGSTHRMPCGLTYVYDEKQMDLYCEGYLMLSSSAYHEHSCSSRWYANGYEHWHLCSCGEAIDLEYHIPSPEGSCLQRSVCEVCGAKYGNLMSHNYNRKVTDASHQRSEATCSERATYYYSCSCGAIGDKFYYEEGDILPHTFTEMKRESKYIAIPASCVSGAVYYYSCQCGAIGEETFRTEELGDHDFADGECIYCGLPGENPPTTDQDVSNPDDDFYDPGTECIRPKSLIEVIIEAIIEFIIAIFKAILGIK